MKNKCRRIIIAILTSILMMSCVQVDNTVNPYDESTISEGTQYKNSYNNEAFNTLDDTYENDTSNDELKSYLNTFVGYFH